MNHVAKKPFSAKRIIIYGAFLVVIAALLGIAYLYVIRSHAREATYESLSEIAELYADNIDSKITGNMQTLIAIATIMGTYDTNDVSAFTYALALENPKNAFDTMAYITADGALHGLGMKNANLSGEDFFKNAMAGTAGYGFIDSPVLGNDMAIYSAPLYSGNIIIGVLIGVSSSNSYRSMVEKAFFSGEGFINVINKKGDILINSRNPNNSSGISNVLDEVHFKNEKQKQNFLSGLNLSKSGILEYDVKGMTRMVAYAPVHAEQTSVKFIGVDELYVTAIVPSSVANEHGNYIVRATLALVCSLVIIVILLLVRSAKKNIRNRKKVENFAYFDQLTGIYNVIKFKLEAEKIFSASTNKQLAIIKFDVNNFKLINDIYGFKIGDKVLCNISSAIKKNLYDVADGIFGRISNDDFVVLTPYTDNESINAGSERFFRLADKACAITVPNYRLDFSIGVCLWNGIDTPQTMIEKATMAQKKS